LRYDWADITSSAYLTILELGLREYPIPAKKIKCKDVIISSYQQYAKITGVSVEQILTEYEIEDALLLKELRPGLRLILYNKDKYDARLKHTLWHEIGHIKRNHNKHGDDEEIEAHFFAAQANAPNIIINAIVKRGYSINVQFLVEHFGLSKDSATKKIEYLSKYGFEHTNEYDDVMLMQFSDYININYPSKTQHIYDDYFDELERARDNWR